MKKNLSRLETILEGFQLEASKNFHPLRSLKVGDFVYGKVVGFEKNAQVKKI